MPDLQAFAKDVWIADGPTVRDFGVIFVAIIAAQVVGDLVNLLLGRAPEGAIGVTVAGALLSISFEHQFVLPSGQPRPGK